MKKAARSRRRFRECVHEEYDQIARDLEACVREACVREACDREVCDREAYDPGLRCGRDGLRTA